MTHRTAPAPSLQAVLFDMDGTLVDTEQLWWEAVDKVAAGLGYGLTDGDQPDVLGRPVEHTAAVLGRAVGADVEQVAGALHREFAARVRAGVVPRPGAVDLLVALRSEGVPTALVTASPRQVADIVLDALDRLGAGRFTTTVTADDTPRTKPDPDPYLAACAALGVPPEACVAVEDTPTGVASAEAAGCQVLAVPSLAPIDPAPGRTVLASLADTSPDRLRSLLGPAAGLPDGRAGIPRQALGPRFPVEAFTTRRARVGDPFHMTVAGLVRSTHPVTFAKAEGPEWARVGDDGTITGIPAEAGDTEVTVTATDPHGGTALITARVPVAAADEPLVRSLRVMSWNLWLGGTSIDGHRDKQLKVLLDADVDVVGLQETLATSAQELAEALGWDHHRAGDNLGILSRYPITGRLGAPDPGFYGATGARIRLDDRQHGADAAPQEIVLWSAHLGYTPYGPYDACFDGLEEDRLIAREEESGRLGQIRDILRDLAPDLARSATTPVLLVGDFNAPSHLDWTAAAAPAHGGRGPVAWPVTLAAEAAGLRDSYREAHPDPVLDPGVTWSPIHPVHEDGSGRPEPQDRIDFVLCAGDRLEVNDSTALTSGNVRHWPDVAANEWPSDHAAVVTTFGLRPAGTATSRKESPQEA
ncbi:HAD-IA family hydrolase [Streptomyces sp. NPDC002004]